MAEKTRAPGSILAAIGITSAVLLAYQIAATRILSATVSYHAAFAVIALVMLGLAASGTRVYLDRKESREKGRISNSLVYGAGSLVLGTFLIVGSSAIPIEGYQRVVATFAALLAFFPPFYFAGYAISYILTEYADDIGRVYWSDLVGAAIGCWSLAAVLSLVTPVRLGLICAVLLGVAAVLVSRTRKDGRRRFVGIATGITLAITVVGLVFTPVTRLRHAKAVKETPIWTDWNHLSRVSVYEDALMLDAGKRLRDHLGVDASLEKMADRVGIGWGLSWEFRGTNPDSRYLLLDHDAGTPIIEGGAAADLEILRWDVTAAGHHVMEGALDRVFIVGGGGGRDILTAREFGAEEIDVVELNPAVVGLVEEEMADYSGRPYSEDGVNAIVGEARAELSRRPSGYDLIQVSMIDTWAASSSGAMVLTENVLYTREAFDLYRERLADDGVLSISRWYHPRTYGELGRLLAMVGDALQRGGVEAIEEHVAVLYVRAASGGYVSTVLMKLEPFSPDEIATLREVAGQMKFTMLWPPAPGSDPEIAVADLLRGVSPDGTTRYELAPATDDRPFFFNTYRPFGSYWAALQDGNWEETSPATSILLLLLAIAIFASRILVVRPLREHTEDTDEFPVAARVYFACLGLGFMCVELAMIQRFTMYLGHPTYSLTVVLSSLLLFGGIGSWLSQRIDTARRTRFAALGVFGCILFIALLLPFLLNTTEGLALGVRQAISVATIAPVGIALGMMYPSGIRLLANTGRTDAVPWAWAVNGIWGVYASIVGMLVAMTWGYTALLVVGGATYLTAWWAIGAMSHERATSREPRAMSHEPDG